MKTHSRYYYITFTSLIWPKIDKPMFISMVENFLARVKLNPDVVENLLGRTELRKLIEKDIPKMLRLDCKTVRSESNKDTVWHIFVIGQWSVSALKAASKTSRGVISYDPSWEEQDYFDGSEQKDTWENSTYCENIDPYSWDYDPRFNYNGVNKIPKL